ncbi:MAG: DUF4410 domain-containing protein [Deltaproteobacteria bacterium]|jgi:hypothetical protein|nr:DUF4410 domain-containing protein [Deltaproteobacteria bacterium]
MKRKLCILFSFSLLFFAAACSTKVSYVPLDGGARVEPSSHFSVGQVTDNSGFKFPEGETETVVLTQAMAEALEKSLRATGNLGEGQWIINVDITQYAPGNAFARWLLPGAGATVLGVVANIVDQNGVAVARVPIVRSIGFGGAYTVGAWKYVFTEVSEAIVDVLIHPEKRVTAKQ